MIASAFHVGIYLPLYNGLVFLIDKVPGHDVGIAVIVLTLVVKLVLFPLSLRVARTQEEQKKVAPFLEEIKKKHKGNKQGEAEATMALYKTHNIHPFSGILLLLVQLPILFGLYFVFARGGLPTINPGLLFHFVEAPTFVNMEFLNLINIAAHHSIILAILAGASQFVYAQLSAPPPIGEKGSFQADMAKSMNIQIRYVLPVIIAIISYSLAAAVPLYWFTSNLFMIAQEYIVRKHVRSART